MTDKPSELVVSDVERSKNLFFRFEDGANVIDVRCTGATGKETVYVNDKLFLKQRNFLKLKSVLSFQVNGDFYQARLVVTNLFIGPIFCSLYKNGNLFAQQKIKFLFRDPNVKTLPWYRDVFIVGTIFVLACIAATYADPYISQEQKDIVVLLFILPLDIYFLILFFFGGGSQNEVGRMHFNPQFQVIKLQ